MYLARRFQDAWKVLWGRSEAQQEVLAIRTEWVELQAHIANMMAQVNRWAQRVAKQEQRAIEAQMQHTENAAPTQVARVVGLYPPPATRKAELRRRLSKMRGIRAPTSLSSPPDEGEESP